MAVYICIDCCMINEQLARLISRKISGEATAEELQELEQWLHRHPEDQYFADMFFSYWSNQSSHPPEADIAADLHFSNILARASKTETDAPVTPSKSIKVVGLFKKIAVAAFIASAIFIPAILLKSKEKKLITQSKNEVMAKKGARSKIILPDGTQVWLNSESRIEYDHSFNDSTREVTLDGEAYFDVAKDIKRPFIVHTSSIDIRVLGTAFNVKSYPKEKTIETTLIHGEVEITKINEPQLAKVILRPKEKLIYNRPEHNPDDKEAGSVQQVPGQQAPDMAIVALPRNVADTSLKETSWVYNRLVFEGDTFRELALKMERWFNIKIEFKSERVANYRLRGVFENEDVDEAFKALQLISTFKYKINEYEIEIFE